MQNALDYLQSIGARLSRSDVAGHWVVNDEILSMDEIKKLSGSKEKAAPAKAKA